MLLTRCLTSFEPPRTIAAADETAQLAGACCSSSPAASSTQLPRAQSTVTPLALLGALPEPSSAAAEVRSTRPVAYTGSPPHEQRGGGVSEEGRALAPTAQPARGSVESEECPLESRTCAEMSVPRCAGSLLGTSDEFGAPPAAQVG